MKRQWGVYIWLEDGRYDKVRPYGGTYLREAAATKKALELYDLRDLDQVIGTAAPRGFVVREMQPDWPGSRIKAVEG